MDAVTFVDLADQPYCYLRTTGRPHGIEIWFAAVDARLYLISGGGDRSDWVRNLQADASACVRLGDQELRVGARGPLTDPVERARAVAVLHAKYRGQVSGTEQDWQRDAFIVALDPERSAS